MQSDLVELGWTEDHWNRIVNTVSEEAQKARVAAQALPIVGPEDASTLSIPNYTLGLDANPSPFPAGQATSRLTADSEPTLNITTIAVNVQLRAHEIGDPDLKAALTIFRRAANFVARIEDALVFGGRPGPNAPPAGLVGVLPVFAVTGNGPVTGIFGAAALAPVPPPPTSGPTLFNQIVAAVTGLEAVGQLGPFACLLSNELFRQIVDPQIALVLPRDRILPFLQGPLLRSSQIPASQGCVIALSGSPVELVVACDINVRYLQNTLEPRYVFRVSERVALRIKEPQAIALLG